MKILVTGDRKYDSPHTILDAFQELCEEHNISPTDMILIHGAARGADSLAGEIGKQLGMDVREYPAHWRHTDNCPEGCREMVGRPAGVIRNQKMLTENPDIEFVLAFHSDISKSKGTKDMLKRVHKAGIANKLYG